MAINTIVLRLLYYNDALPAVLLLISMRLIVLVVLAAVALSLMATPEGLQRGFGKYVERAKSLYKKG